MALLTCGPQPSPRPPASEFPDRKKERGLIPPAGIGASLDPNFLRMRDSAVLAEATGAVASPYKEAPKAKSLGTKEDQKELKTSGRRSGTDV